MAVTLWSPSIEQAVAGDVGRCPAERARQRRTILVAVNAWPAADLILEASAGACQGLGVGRGRLRCRKVKVMARGRGGALRPRQGLDVAAGPERANTYDGGDLIDVADGSADETPLTTAALARPSGAAT